MNPDSSIPFRAPLDYFQHSRLADGRLARFYELRSNKPLYFTRDYTLTYDDGDVPTHYTFKIADWTEAIRRRYERLKKLSAEELKSASPDQSTEVTPRLVAEVKSIIAAQDARGRWVEEGGLRFHRPKDPTIRVIKCATFNRNVELLSRYLTATRP